MPSSKWTPELQLKLLITVLRTANMKISKVDLDKVKAAMGSEFTFEGIRQQYQKLLRDPEGTTANAASSPTTALPNGGITVPVKANRTKATKGKIKADATKKRKNSVVKSHKTGVDEEDTNAGEDADGEEEDEREGRQKRIKSED